MSGEVEALRAEVAALRAQLEASTSGSIEQSSERVTRRRLLTGLAGLGAATAAGVATAAPAAAGVDGEPLVIGEDNHADHTTTLRGDVSGEPVLSVEIEGAERRDRHDTSARGVLAEQSGPHGSWTGGGAEPQVEVRVHGDGADGHRRARW